MLTPVVSIETVSLEKYCPELAVLPEYTGVIQILMDYWDFPFGTITSFILQR